MADSRPVRAPLKGNLRLNRTQEDRLMKLLIERRCTVLQEMGWVTSASEITPHYAGWLEERKIAWECYGNDFSYRLQPRFGALFRLFNSSVNVPKRAARMFTAKACDQILNTDPWAGVKAEGEEDLDTHSIELATRLLTRKLGDAKAKEVLRDAIERAAVSGEAVIKLARKQKKAGPKRGKVWIHGGFDAIDEATGAMQHVPEEEMRDLNDRPITEHDTWEPDTIQPGRQRLKRQPEIMQPDGARLSDYEIPLTQEPQWGDLDVSIIPYNDFVISPNAETIRAADYRGHSIQWEEGELRAYIEGSKLGTEAEAWLDGIHKGEDGTNKTESTRYCKEGTWWPATPQGMIPKIQMEESWVRFDLYDDGRHIIEIAVLWDVRNEFPVGYDYMDDVSGLGDELPFIPIRIIKEKDRWHGVGFYQLLSNEHGFIDRQWNRIDSRSSTSGVIKYQLDGAVVELGKGIPLEFNSPRVYTITKEFKDHPEKALGFIEAPKMDENIWNMLQQAIQNSQSMSGTMQPSDSAGSDLNQSDTATEQEFLNQESDTLSGHMVQDLLDGITDVLKGSAYIVFHDFNLEDTRKLMGDEKARKLEEYIVPHMGEIMYRIKPLLTKQQNERAMQSITQSLGLLVGEMSWRELRLTDSDMAKAAKPLYEKALAIHDIEDPKKLLPDPPPPVDPLTGLPYASHPVQQPPPALPAAAPVA